MFFQDNVFGRVWSSLFSILVGSGDLPNRPDPSKVVVLLKREHDFQKIMFFYKKSSFNKNHVFFVHKLWVLKNHPKPIFLGVAVLEYCCFLRHRIPNFHWDPPGTPLGLLFGHFGTTFGAMLDHSWMISGQSWYNLVNQCSGTFGTWSFKNWKQDL